MTDHRTRLPDWVSELTLTDLAWVPVTIAIVLLTVLVTTFGQQGGPIVFDPVAFGVLSFVGILLSPINLIILHNRPLLLAIPVQAIVPCAVILISGQFYSGPMNISLYIISMAFSAAALRFLLPPRQKHAAEPHP